MDKEKVLKKFKCPSCETIHIVDSSLNVEHSYFEEDERTAQQIAEDKGAGNPKKESGKSGAGESESPETEEENKEEKEEGKKEEFSESFEKNDEEDNEFNWGGWK